MELKVAYSSYKMYDETLQQCAIQCQRHKWHVATIVELLTEKLTDAVAVVTQEAELNELRATIELLRQQGHAQLTPFRRPPLTVSMPYDDVPSNGRLSRIVIVRLLLLLL